MRIFEENRVWDRFELSFKGISSGKQLSVAIQVDDSEELSRSLWPAKKVKRTIHTS